MRFEHIQIVGDARLAGSPSCKRSARGDRVLDGEPAWSTN